MFPAYSKQCKEGDATNQEAPNWLCNPSFKAGNILHLPTASDIQDQSLAHFLSSDEGSSDDITNVNLKSGDTVTSKNNRNTKEDQKSYKKSSKKLKKEHHSLRRSSSKSRSRSRSPLKRKKKKSSKRADYSSEDEKKREKKKYHERHKKKKRKYEYQDSSEKKTHKSKTSKIKISRPDSILPILPNKVFIEDVHNLKPEHAFRVDRSRDDNNLAYMSIYSENIARRKRLINYCLGTHNGNTVWVKEKSKSKEISERYYGKNSQKHVKQESMKCYKISDKIDIMSDLIPIDDDVGKSDVTDPIYCSNGSVNKEDKNSAASVNPLGIYDKGTELWLLGKGNMATIDQEDIAQQDISKHDRNLQLEMASYNKKLGNEPHNIDLWLEFVKFQEKVASMSGKVERNVKDVHDNRPMRSSVIEIKMAVLDKAIESNPSCIRLKLEKLQLGQYIWEPEKLLKEWNTLLFKYSNNGALWLKYIAFRRSWSSGYKVSGVCKAIEKSVKTLGSIVNGDMKSHPRLPHTEKYMLALMNQQCRVYQESGHLERAVAQYQAMFEYNLFFPVVLESASSEDIKDFFEAFWESSCARIGENGAVGWCQWVEKKGDVPTVEPLYDSALNETMEQEILTSPSPSNSIHKTWLAMEKQRQNRHWLPWKPNTLSGETEDDCDDPDRQVLSDDLSSSMFRIQEDENQFLLVYSFLEFLGICDKVISMDSSISWTDEIFSLRTRSDSKVLDHTANPFLKSENFNKFIYNFFEQVIPVFKHNLVHSTLLKKLYMSYRVQSLKQSDHAITSKEQKSIKKWAKSLMKEESNRDNLCLWHEYANMENTLGNVQDAIKVLTASLSSNKSKLSEITDDVKKTQISSLYLFCSKTILKMEKGYSQSDKIIDEKVGIREKHFCCHLLHSLATGDPIPDMSLLFAAEATENSIKQLTASKIMKAKRLYNDYTDELINRHCADVASNPKNCYSLNDYFHLLYSDSTLINWITCSAYFAYLTADFFSAEQLFKAALERIKPEDLHSHNPKSEYWFDSGVQFCNNQYTRLYENYIGLCKYHVDSVKMAPLKLLRQPLGGALQVLPNHHHFLELFVKVETEASVSSRVRQYFRHVTLCSGSSQAWLFAVLAELLKRKKMQEYEAENQLITGHSSIVKETGVSHQMRAWFERGVNHPEAGKSVLMWRLYALFELEQERSSEAKAVLYRALSNCPGSKALHMDMIENFPEALQEITDMMIEREIRLRTPLEELEILLKPEDPSEKESQGQDTVDEDGMDSDTDVKSTESVKTEICVKNDASRV